MKKILVMALAIGSFTACKKSDDSPAQLDVTMANIAGTWKITSESTNVGGTSVDLFNNTSFYAVCEKDDTYVFTTGGNVTNNDAGTSCSPITTSTTSAFTVNASTKAINIPSNVGQTGGYNGTVKSLTASAMTVERVSTIPGTTMTETTTVVFAH